MGVGVFLGTMAVLFALQVFVLNISGSAWFTLSMFTVLGGMFLHRTLGERRRMAEESCDFPTT